MSLLRWTSKSSMWLCAADPGNLEVDLVGVAVGVEDPDDRRAELAGLVDREEVLLGVDDPHGGGDPAHGADAAQGALELVLLALEDQQLLLREAGTGHVVEVELLEPLRPVSRLEIVWKLVSMPQQYAEPVSDIKMSQTPAAGTQVNVGSTIGLVISLGPVTVLVPDVVGSTQAGATTALTGLGLTVSTTTANSNTVPFGNVISQTPTAGSTAIVPSNVALVISAGVSNGLIAAFGFEEQTGTVAIDSSPLPRNGTVAGGAVRVATGKIGRAIQFDGVNDAVNIIDGAAGTKLDLTTGMTIEAWVNPSAQSGWETVVYKERGAAGTGLLSVRAVFARRRAAGGWHGRTGRLHPNRSDGSGRSQDAGGGASVERLDAPRSDLQRCAVPALRQRRHGHGPGADRRNGGRQPAAADRRQQRADRRVLQRPHRRSPHLQPRAHGSGDQCGHDSTRGAVARPLAGPDSPRGQDRHNINTTLGGPGTSEVSGLTPWVFIQGQPEECQPCSPDAR